MSRTAKILDTTAAILFGACVCFSLWLSGLGPMTTGGVALLITLFARGALAKVGGSERHHGFDALNPEFDVAPDEKDVLLLEDRLVGVDADSNVVRLFGTERLPGAAPGELVERIDQFLGARRGGDGVPPPTDAAQELYEALAAIRQTIRH